MTKQEMPDTFKNTLVKHTKTGEIGRVIRDDGENGLHISPPDTPVMMVPISRDEFRKNWELYQTVEQQLATGGDRPAKDTPFAFKGVNLSSQVNMPTTIDS